MAIKQSNIENQECSKRDQPPHRRNFLTSAAAIGGGYWLATSNTYATQSANEKLNIGVIGVGGRGAADLAGVAHENIVAICDVNTSTLAKVSTVHTGAKKYVDYRKLLEQKNLDAVVIGTPDHHHAPATIRALARGLHVYCEKPLTHTVREARMVAEMAAKQKVATQMGTQNHEHPGYLETVELIQTGAIGDVSEVHIVTDRPGRWWPQGLPTPQPTASVPQELKWDEWLGPARQRDYHKSYVPFRWRGWWDFGCGAIGDMAIHLMDPAFWALKLGGPVTVSAMGPKPLDDCGPTWMIVRFQFEKRGDMPPCSVYWYEGNAQPPKHIAEELPMNGSLFVGTDGRLAVAHGGNPRLLPEEKFKDVKRPEPYLKRSPGHHQQWIDACKTGSETGSNFQYAGPFTEVVLLGNVAFRCGQTVHFDPTTMRITNIETANQYLDKEYRDGWGLT